MAASIRASDFSRRGYAILVVALATALQAAGPHSSTAALRIPGTDPSGLGPGHSLLSATADVPGATDSTGLVASGSSSGGAASRQGGGGGSGSSGRGTDPWVFPGSGSGNGGGATNSVGGLQRLLQAAKQYRSAGGRAPMLKPRQIHRAMYLGDIERIRNFVRRMAEGENVTIALLGGSISKGMGAVRGEPSFQQWLEQWLAAVAPAPPGQGRTASGGGGDGGGDGSGGNTLGQIRGTEGAGSSSSSTSSSNTSTVRIVNAACPATTSAYMNMCLREYLTDAAAPDLVLVEYAINDDPFPQPAWENEARRSFEQLLRKLLRLPRRPAVVLLNTYRWHSEFSMPGTGRSSLGLYYSNTESQYFEFATYYGLPMLSLKAAVYHQMAAGVRSFQADTLRYLARADPASDPEALFYEDAMHPSGLTGHRAIAELVTGLLLQVARGLVVRPWRQSEAELVSAPLPPHLIPDNGDSAVDTCTMGDKLRAAAVEVQGFEWLNEGRNPAAPKWGFTATSPGASLTLLLPTAADPAAAAANQPGSSGNGTATSTLGAAAALDGSAAATAAAAAGDGLSSSSTTSVLVILAYLRSYEHMGVAEVTCAGGCVCGDRAAAGPAGGAPDGGRSPQGAEVEGQEVVARLDGHWESRTSQLQLGCFPAALQLQAEGSGAAACRVGVRVASQTRSGGHKVKVGGLIVSHTAPHLAYTMCQDNLEAARRAAGFLERR